MTTAINFVRDWLANRQILLVRYGGGNRRQWIQDVDAIRSKRTLLLNHVEATQIISILHATAKIQGDLAEVGVAYGASARIIADHSSNRTLHLFDTFDGLPVPDACDSQKFAHGDFKSDVDSVRAFLSDANVQIHKGYFPSETGSAVADRTFSFVHLDVDLYRSTIESLKFFYPRMSPGAVLISHDYGTAEGVNRAFEEFFADKPEPYIGLTGYQCLFVKL